MIRDILAVAALAAVISGIGYMFTVFVGSPAGRRILAKGASIEDRLRTLSPSRQARIIPAVPRKAFLKAMPWSVPAGALLYIWLIGMRDAESCTFVFGTSYAVIALTMFTHGLPLLFAVFSLFGIPSGLKVLRHGYFPPLDSAHIFDTIATKGIASRLRGWLLLVLPLFTFYLVYLGHTAFMAILDGRSAGQFMAQISDACLAQ